MSKGLHWADVNAERVIKYWPGVKTFVCAAGITPSGKIHIGNFREIITVFLVAQALKDKGKKVRFIYSWDDYDRFRKVPKNIPKDFEKYLGMPVSDIPDPFGKEKSYARYLEKELEDAIKPLNLNPEFIYQNEKYKKCEYAKEIRFTLRNRKKIRKILNEYRKEPLPENWIPLNVYCKKCKKDTVIITGYDEEYTITYECTCGEKGKIDFRKDGSVNLPWRVDWPMRWYYENVNFEPAGKEHHTHGGSFTTSKEIIKEVWVRNPPTTAKYDFITIKGAGGKMSSSLGNVILPKDVLEVYEPEIMKYLFVTPRLNTEFAISFDLDVIKVYEDFDRTERIYYKKEKVSDTKYKIEKRNYELSSIKKIPKKIPFQPSFRHLTNILLMNELDIKKTIKYYEKHLKTKFDQERLNIRANCAKNWLEKYAPEEFKYEINKKTPKIKVPKKYKEAFKEISGVLKNKKYEEKELHQEFYEIITKYELNNKEFFEYAYKILINKSKGPKLARFILDLGDKAIKLFSDL
jgi:lysyl-tRNA synthetase class 1